jgi:hypothetical protein
MSLRAFVGVCLVLLLVLTFLFIAQQYAQPRVWL